MGKRSAHLRASVPARKPSWKKKMRILSLFLPAKGGWRDGGLETLIIIFINRGLASLSMSDPNENQRIIIKREGGKIIISSMN